MAASIVLLSLISICTSITTDCNYVVDFWAYQDIQPPTLDPTAAPSPSPTDAPTKAPTFFNESIVQQSTTEPPDRADGGSSSSTDFEILLLNPYTTDYCYNWGQASFNEPYNNFAIKYECNGYNLIRKIYWDTTECSSTHNNIDITEFDSSQNYQATTFVCGQSVDCKTLPLRLVSAETMNPTAAPTPAPITGSFNTTEQTNGAKSDSGFANCSDIIGPDATPIYDIDMIYSSDVCINTNKLVMFNRSYNWYFGWSCNDDDQYVFGLYNDSECSIIPDGDSYGFVKYRNDNCVGEFWTYLDCNAFTNDPTRSPTLIPTYNPTNVPTHNNDNMSTMETTMSGSETTRIGNLSKANYVNVIIVYCIMTLIVTFKE